ncbi:hypothetical protein E5676_scaffold970G00100 [Cucumis melo var. makuwa]|uniref:Uncharacterized protein n=1 Tax=Cucumis melo var. makuwa TaxID=1194695 RepID=A0A5A7UU54_CUCMM|nr:hypothetical protein E6C27_scaffold126G00250 [Cucumis melo var. makuwa]TYK27461.1 hypothetical protein E5676_scaffold970G00100 [Cucumis melo var. makuwa]
MITIYACNRSKSLTLIVLVQRSRKNLQSSVTAVSTFFGVQALQETGVLLTHYNVGESEKNVQKGYVDVLSGVEPHVKRSESEEVFPTHDQNNVGNASPDVVFPDEVYSIEDTSPDAIFGDEITSIERSSASFLSTHIVASKIVSFDVFVHPIPTFRCVRNFFLYMSWNYLHSLSCGPSAWVPNQSLLSSLVIYPTPNRISHPQRVADYPLE